MRFNSQQIESACIGLCTQNPGLKEEEFETNPQRGSDKINMLKQGRKTAEENKLYRTAWTHIWIQAHKEVDFEPSAKTGANTTETLVSLY